jgi:squalene-hopene/tetraprenyl-beta-curcumene cyclase
MIKKSFVLFFCVCFLVTVKGYAQNISPVVDISIIHEARKSISRGIEYLRGTQQDDGSWGHYPAITALVITAMLKSPGGIVQPGDPDVKKGLDFIIKHVKPDGGIYADDPMRCYNTAISLLALVEAHNTLYNDIISNAREYIIKLQADERVGYSYEDSLYGGIGYGDDKRPDMSNLQTALEALARTESYEKVSEADLKTRDGSEPLRGNRPYYEKAIVFLTRSQNLASTNPYFWASNDGGFIYYPGNSKAGGTRSYGSMTYAGLKSFIYARVDKNDERVKASYRWITDNYTVKENPGIGDNGLFYYYHTMSKALNVYGVDFIETPDRQNHNWREDLMNQLMVIQKEDGSWINDSARWWENNRDLVTAYTILSLINAGWTE